MPARDQGKQTKFRLDPVLAHQIDETMREDPDLDLNKILDAALRLWFADRLAPDMEDQFTLPPEPRDEFLFPAESMRTDERSQWQRIQRALARRLFDRSDAAS